MVQCAGRVDVQPLPFVEPETMKLARVTFNREVMLPNGEMTSFVTPDKHGAEIEFDGIGIVTLKQGDALRLYPWANVVDAWPMAKESGKK